MVSWQKNKKNNEEEKKKCSAGGTRMQNSDDSHSEPSLTTLRYLHIGKPENQEKPLGPG